MTTLLPDDQSRDAGRFPGYHDGSRGPHGGIGDLRVRDRDRAHVLVHLQHDGLSNPHVQGGPCLCQIDRLGTAG